MPFLRPLRDETETGLTTNVLLKVSLVKWLSGNRTDIDVVGPQQLYWKAYRDMKFYKNSRNVDIPLFRIYN